MKLVCTLCDRTTAAGDDTLLAKRHRNHPLLLYLCPDCRERIAAQATARLERRRAGRDRR